MYTLGIPKRQYRRTTQVLGHEGSEPIEHDVIKQDDGFYLFKFPNVDEFDFKNIIMLLKQNGITTIGADEQLTERKIMKLTDLITEAPTLEEMENNPLLNALKRVIQTWSTKQYANDKIKAEEFFLDIEELIEDFEEESTMRSIAVDAPDRLQEQKLRKLIRKTIRE